MSEKIYSMDGVFGKHLDVYEEKVVISTKPGFLAALAGNTSDGEKTIYFEDCIGIQFKKREFSNGFLQFETASNTAKTNIAAHSNYDNENSFVWSQQSSNLKMIEIANYCKKRLDEYKSGKHKNMSVQISPAEELKKFKELLDMGVISQEEFDAKKKQILGL